MFSYSVPERECFHELKSQYFGTVLPLYLIANIHTQAHQMLMIAQSEYTLNMQYVVEHSA